MGGRGWVKIKRQTSGLSPFGPQAPLPAFKGLIPISVALSGGPLALKNFPTSLDRQRTCIGGEFSSIPVSQVMSFITEWTCGAINQPQRKIIHPPFLMENALFFILVRSQHQLPATNGNLQLKGKHSKNLVIERKFVNMWSALCGSGPLMRLNCVHTGRNFFFVLVEKFHLLSKFHERKSIKKMNRN